MFAQADEIHISVTFSWDLKEAERLEREWKQVATVKIGGPAIGMPGGEFVPGEYLRKGYVITSRGCPNRCWFCSVPKREGGIRELPIREGWNVLDDNLLACSDQHISAVFSMLANQGCKAEFTGGLEAARLKKWHVEALGAICPKQIFFAYDTNDDLEPLRGAGKMLHEVGFERHVMRCYVLIGYPRDTIVAAERRLRETVEAGFYPMAMLYRDVSGRTEAEWKRFQRRWARPAMIARELKCG